VKFRVLQLIGNLYTGGSERQAVQLTELLLESSRYEVCVACMDARGELGKDLQQMGFTTLPAFPIKRFYDHTMVIQLVRFARFLREQRIDIIHTHDFYTNVFGMMGAALAGVPVRIASRRETTVGWRTPAQKFVERRAYQLAHAIVTNAQAVQQHLLTEGIPGRKLVTIYNGLKRERVTTEQAREAVLTQFNLPRTEPCQFVTIVANLSHSVKDHPTFLRAAQRISQAVPAARFVLAGQGPLTEKMRVYAEELGLGAKVFFTGRCDQVADLLSVSDVCVLSSVAEGFSNSILEYMGAGRPVVATNVGGALEAVTEGKTGYLVNPGDDATMAHRIIELLRNPAHANALGRCGQQVVEEKFSCAAQLAQTEKLYDQLLTRSKMRTSRMVETTTN
jgi:glycosyltransferase involved in cell wall biosynthesis